MTLCSCTIESLLDALARSLFNAGFLLAHMPSNAATSYKGSLARMGTSLKRHSALSLSRSLSFFFPFVTVAAPPLFPSSRPIGRVLSAGGRPIRGRQTVAHPSMLEDPFSPRSYHPKMALLLCAHVPFFFLFLNGLPAV